MNPRDPNGDRFLMGTSNDYQHDGSATGRDGPLCPGEGLLDPRPIVVGVDGTSGDRAAVNWAAQEAVRRSIDLVVVHTTDATAVWPALASVVDPLPRPLSADAVAVGRAILDSAVESIAVSASARLNIVPTLYEASTVPALVHLSRRAQLVVLGAGGTRSWGCVGSVLPSIVRRAECPVAIIPAELSGPRSAQRAVVIGTDRLTGAEDAWAIGLHRASLTGGDVVAVVRQSHRGDERWMAVRHELSPCVPVWARLMGSPRTHRAAILQECQRAQLLVLAIGRPRPAGIRRALAVVRLARRTRLPVLVVMG